MKTYYLQQIWLINYPQIFDFYADIFKETIDNELLKAIWEMPREPESEF